MPTWAYITIGVWLLLQLPMGMLLGRYLRGVRRSYPRVAEAANSQGIAGTARGQQVVVAADTYTGGFRITASPLAARRTGP